MPTILWLVLSSIGALILLLCLWLGYRALEFRRLQPLIFDFLALRDVEAALEYIDDHPRLLTPAAGEFLSVFLDRAWRRGDARTFVSGMLHSSLLAGCRKYGVETARQMASAGLQARLDVANSPSWQRALEFLGKLVADKEASIPSEEVDEELVEAMERIMDLLRPLAANEEALAIQDEILRALHQMLRDKAEGTLPPA
jgi:hypothetical protein